MKIELSYYFENYEENSVFDNLTKEVKNVWDIKKNAKRFIEEKVTDKINNGELLGNVTFIGNYFIDEGTKIYNGVTIEGPVYIGKNCEIKPGAYIRPGSIICDNCSVGFNSEVKNSIVQNGAKIASLAFVGDSILGKSARIGSGVITANRRFDQKNITVKTENGERIDTNDSFFGCILGDYSRIGANSSVSPGTFIGPYSWIYPLTSVRGFIPAEKRVYNKHEIILEENEKVILK